MYYLYVYKIYTHMCLYNSIILYIMYTIYIVCILICRGGKGIMADVFITLQETKYIILIIDIMIK